ncbi:uncharacterized protein [Oscarella lobularis]|uniref:uncharacterized protein n=1 Tax=Oscarella lobularis TaxID=121494 RepID=UPI0033139B8F
MEKRSASFADSAASTANRSKQNGVDSRTEDEKESAFVATREAPDDAVAASSPTSARAKSKSSSFFRSLKKRFGGSSSRKRREQNAKDSNRDDHAVVSRSATLPVPTRSRQFPDITGAAPGQRASSHEMPPPTTPTRVLVDQSPSSSTSSFTKSIQLCEANSIEDLVDERGPEPLPIETTRRYASPPTECPIYDTAAVARAFGPLRDVGRWYSHEQERRRLTSRQPQPLPAPPTSGGGVGVEEEVVYTRVAPLLGSEQQQQGQSAVMQGLKNLSVNGWYWGPLTRQEAEEKLDRMPDGAFLVRDSSDERYLLSVSFRSQGRTLHTRIEYFNGKFSFYRHLEADGYRSVVELIHRSMEDSRDGIFCFSRGRGANARSYPVRLTQPLSRFIHVRSLQHHCRFVIRQLTRFDLIQQLPLPTGMKGFLKESKY